MRLAASRAVQSSGDVGVAVIESESISGAPATAGGSGHGALRWLPWVVAALALVPLGSMLAMVLGGNEMQWADYWEILPRVTNPDGSFAPRGLFEYQNSHPIAVASAVYWVNAHLTGGSNIALGIFVVAVVAVQVVILVWALPRQ
ncbi:MAG: hypothetical protein JXA83_14315, partial [Acidimicrobiales bacterium]|nr:hypothetical protein [Acidimicrobiales bacterium]